MSAPKDVTAPGAGLLAQLSTRRAGLAIVIALGVINLAGYGLEFFLTEDGFAKYRDVTGPFEFVLMPLTAAAILAAWGLRWLLGRRGDYYERAAGDVTDSKAGEGRDD
ncbi:hypothetical protein F1654_00460 [Alkalicaulis satelles]|uniref:Uncharacterized protein n=1 Tax=Alkalicaulis satelles TaxID=2609175 RepID=A0A5M6ZLF4_9PROT|nr:hypothetical protein [Alkalicaulis satelles]KAA5804517.1 hypothetical protein F1654_00460 [Alkalicaulis satelles]